MTTYTIDGDTRVEGTGGSFGSIVLSTTSEDVVIVPNPTTVTDTTLTLPTTIGAQGEVLTTDGSGTLTWTVPTNPFTFKCWVLTIQLPSSTQTGSFTSGSWITRVPTTIISYPPGDTDVQLNGSNIDLAAGTYFCEGNFCSAAVQSTMARVIDANSLVTLISGQSGRVFSVSLSNRLDGYIEAGAPISIVLQQRCSLTNNVTGFGINDAVLGPTYTPLSFSLIKLV